VKNKMEQKVEKKKKVGNKKWKYNEKKNGKKMWQKSEKKWKWKDKK